MGGRVGVVWLISWLVVVVLWSMRPIFVVVDVFVVVGVFLKL